MTDQPGVLPAAPLKRWLSPITRFLKVESASGIVLMVCTMLALVLANSPYAASFRDLWETPVALMVGGFTLTGTLGHLVINDGLMAIFFFVVGLEIKRELVVGELRDPRAALLPIFAALGGMVVPALIYYALQWGAPGQRGWAIPMATDIAFVAGVLALLGRRAPFALKVLLLTLAIVDDLGAVLIIAFVFTERIAWGWLGAAAVGFVITSAMNQARVRRVGAYIVVGAGIWLAVLKSGVHPTVAGVLLGLLTPTSALIGDKSLYSLVGSIWERLQLNPDKERRTADLERLKFVAREAVSPLDRLETSLHPWVAFVIMPIFALANAGVPLELASLKEPVALAVATGLVLGKPIGVLIACGIAVRLGLARLPTGVGWPVLAGGACLAGIGFTMALFLNGLAFPAETFPTQAAAGKIGTLVGSLISAIAGLLVLLVAMRRTPPDQA